MLVCEYSYFLCFILVVKLNSELVGEMFILFTVAIVAGVKFFGEQKGDKGRSSNANKTQQQMDFKDRPSSGKISSSMKLIFMKKHIISL